MLSSYIRKQAEWYEEANNANLQEFKEALISQEAAFQQRLEAEISAAVAATEERLMGQLNQMLVRTRILEARVGDFTLIAGASTADASVQHLPPGTKRLTLTWDPSSREQAKGLKSFQNRVGVPAVNAARVLSACSGLEGLCLGYVKGVNTAGVLCGSQSADRERYSDYGIADLSFLEEHSETLEDLFLSGNTGIKDLSPLKTLRCLRILHIDGCKNVGDLSMLQEIPSLTELYIRDTGLTNACSLLGREGLKIVDK